MNLNSFCRALWRLVLLYKQRSMLQYPTVNKLDRDQIIQDHLDSKSGSSPSTRPPPTPKQPQSSQLPRSGRKMRTLQSGKIMDHVLRCRYRNRCSDFFFSFTAPISTFDRTWTVPSCSTVDDRPATSNGGSSLATAGPQYMPLTQRQVLGEVSYVCQPLAHLGALAAFGRKSWKPWTISVGMDLMRCGKHSEIN